MNGQRPAAGPPSRSGVRRNGDRFQDLFVWGAAMRVIGPERRFSQVEVEINGAGNVDDVVLRSCTGEPDIFAQVKWATNPADLVNEGYLAATSGKGKSLLQKLYDSYVMLSAGGAPPVLRLITNRALDHSDPLLGHVDGRTDLLMPYAGQAELTSAAGRAVDRWADHVGASRLELLAMLEHLQFVTGRTVSAEEEHVCTLMVAAGLDGSTSSLQHGLNTVASWVTGGKRIIPEEDIRSTVESLHPTPPSAILLVQAIDADPHAEDATIALNWVDLFDGDNAQVRVQPRCASDWARMEQDIMDAAAALERDGWRSTLIGGKMRQATFFRIGAALPHVRGHTLRHLQGGELWSTDARKAAIPAPQLQRQQLDFGNDLAVAIGVAIDPTPAVIAYLKDNSIPVSRLLTIQPGGGSDDQSIAGAGQAVAYAQKIRNLVREELDELPSTERIHLFMAGPGGLALLLGHRWNRTRVTTVYEHLGGHRGYTTAFEVDS